MASISWRRDELEHDFARLFVRRQARPCGIDLRRGETGPFFLREPKRHHHGTGGLLLESMVLSRGRRLQVPFEFRRPSVNDLIDPLSGYAESSGSLGDAMGARECQHAPVCRRRLLEGGPSTPPGRKTKFPNPIGNGGPRVAVSLREHSQRFIRKNIVAQCRLHHRVPRWDCHDHGDQSSGGIEIGRFWFGVVRMLGQSARIANAVWQVAGRQVELRYLQICWSRRLCTLMFIHVNNCTHIP